MEEYDVFLALRQFTQEVLVIKTVNPETKECTTYFSPSEHLDLVSRILNAVEEQNRKNQENDYHPWTKTLIRFARRFFPMTSEHRFQHYLVTSGIKMNGTASIEIEIYTPRDAPRMDLRYGRQQSTFQDGGIIDFTFVTYNPKTLEVLEIGEGLKPDKEYFFGRIFMDPVFVEDWAGEIVWSRR